MKHHQDHCNINDHCCHDHHGHHHHDHCHNHHEDHCYVNRDHCCHDHHHGHRHHHHNHCCNKIVICCCHHEHEHKKPHCHIDGSITLNQGNHEVAIKTECAPKNVFLSVCAGGVPVCSGSIDMVGYNILPDGFILYANVQSNVVEVKYIVVK